MTGLTAKTAEVVRRAAMLTYVQAANPVDLGELAEALDDPAISPATLAGWARQDEWDKRREARVGLDVMGREDAQRRREAARASLETLHYQAIRHQRHLRPKSWEAAAGVQMRCAETLRVMAEEDIRANPAADKDEQSDATVASGAGGAWAAMTEEEWQQMAHIALSTRHTKELPAHAPAEQGTGPEVLQRTGDK